MTVIFADTVTHLGRAVEASMASLYDLQTATINAQNRESSSPSNVFRTVRQTLRAEWETLLAFFKNCHAFGEDITFLKESMGKESPEDCLHFLQELGEASAELVDTAKGLRTTINTPVILFSQKQDDFLDLFNASFVPHERRLELASPYDIWSEDAIPSPVEVYTRSEATTSFVDTALASLYPDGKSMFFTTESHFRDMLALYDDVVTFWKTQHDEFLAGSKSMAGITIHRINQITEDWATSKKALKVTIAIISRACDAVGVEARGAPRPTRASYPPEAETSGLGIIQPPSWGEVGRVGLLVMSSQLPAFTGAYTGHIAPTAQTMSAVKPKLAGVTAPSGKDYNLKVKSTQSNGARPPRPPLCHHSNSAVNINPEVDSALG